MLAAMPQLRSAGRLAMPAAAVVRPTPPATTIAPSAGGPVEPTRPADRLEFREQLRRVAVRASGPEAQAIADPRAAARRSAEQMVASLFVQPLLDMALESEAGGPFAPGQGEKTFGPLLNQRLADEIVRKARLPLVDAVVDRILTGTGKEDVDG